MLADQLLANLAASVAAPGMKNCIHGDGCCPDFSLISAPQKAESSNEFLLFLEQPCHNSLGCHGDGGENSMLLRQSHVRGSMQTAAAIVITVMYMGSAGALGTSSGIVRTGWAGHPGGARGRTAGRGAVSAYLIRSRPLGRKINSRACCYCGDRGRALTRAQHNIYSAAATRTNTLGGT